MSRDAAYPEGSVRAVLDTDLVTVATAAALRRRLQPAEVPAGLLDDDGIALLGAVCERLIPQADRARPIDIVGRLLAKFATGGGDGWRYASLPADCEALATGLAGVDESAHALGGTRFAELDDSARDVVLANIQRGTAPGATWARIDPKRWFEELLVAVTETYYAHPLAQEEIGYLGMADAHGWADVGIGARSAHEPVERRSA